MIDLDQLARGTLIACLPGFDVQRRRSPGLLKQHTGNHHAA
ncbi:hypothetical protein ACHPSH_003621 [Escherichia coli]|nr:hypothetical protein [Escherichia coli]